MKGFLKNQHFSHGKTSGVTNQVISGLEFFLRLMWPKFMHCSRAQQHPNNATLSLINFLISNWWFRVKILIFSCIYLKKLTQRVLRYQNYLQILRWKHKWPTKWHMMCDLATLCLRITFPSGFTFHVAVFPLDHGKGQGALHHWIFSASCQDPSCFTQKWGIDFIPTYLPASVYFKPQGWFQGLPIMRPPYSKLPILFPYLSHIFRDSSGVGNYWGSLKIPLNTLSRTSCEQKSDNIVHKGFAETHLS